MGYNLPKMNVHSVFMVKSVDKRQKIIAAAVDLFVEHGLHGTSMQALAKRAGVATGTVYLYFAGKDDLVAEAFHAIIDRCIATMVADYDEAEPIKERFYHLVERLIRFNIGNPLEFRFCRMCAYEPAVMKMVKNDMYRDSPLISALEAGKQQQLLRGLSVHDFVYYILGGLSSVLEWRLFNRKAVSDDDVFEMVEMAWSLVER